jgi:hypothetical protein
LTGTQLWRAPSCCAQGIVDQRMQETPENWRLVYKALLLLEYMVKHGPMVSLWGTAQATTALTKALLTLNPYQP